MRFLVFFALWTTLCFASSTPELDWEGQALSSDLVERVQTQLNSQYKKTAPKQMVELMARLGIAFFGFGTDEERAISAVLMFHQLAVEQKMDPSKISDPWVETHAEKVFGYSWEFYDPMYHITNYEDLWGELDGQIQGMESFKRDVLHGTKVLFAGTQIHEGRPRHRRLLAGGMGKTAAAQAYAKAMRLNSQSIDMSKYSNLSGEKPILLLDVARRLMDDPYLVLIFENVSLASAAGQAQLAALLSQSEIHIPKLTESKDGPKLDGSIEVDLTRSSMFLTTRAGTDYLRKFIVGGSMNIRQATENERVFSVHEFKEVLMQEGPFLPMLLSEQCLNSVIPVFPPSSEAEFRQRLKFIMFRSLRALSDRKERTFHLKDGDALIDGLMADYYEDGAFQEAIDHLNRVITDSAAYTVLSPTQNSPSDCTTLLSNYSATRKQFGFRIPVSQ